MRSSHSTTKDVLVSLEKLQQKLPKTKLHNLQFFNFAYIVITQNFIKNSDLFSNPLTIEHLDVVFADLYFKAVGSTQSNKPNSIWLAATEVGHKSLSQKVCALLLGANAHINYDLTLALFETNKQFSVSKSDFKKAESIFWLSKHSIVQNLYLAKKSNFALNLAANIFILLVLHWRKVAWKNFCKLQKSTITTQQVKLRTTKISKRILFISRLLR